MEKTDVMVGAYTPYSTNLSAEAKEIFQKATKGLYGVDYTPLAFATQVVEGINYRFFCNARYVYPNAVNEGVIVEIYQPFKGNPIIHQIKRCR